MACRQPAVLVAVIAAVVVPVVNIPLRDTIVVAALVFSGISRAIDRSEVGGGISGSCTWNRTTDTRSIYLTQTAHL